jgi:hypothetical protein
MWGRRCGRCWGGGLFGLDVGEDAWAEVYGDAAAVEDESKSEDVMVDSMSLGSCSTTGEYLAEWTQCSIAHS